MTTLYVLPTADTNCYDEFTTGTISGSQILHVSATGYLGKS